MGLALGRDRMPRGVGVRLLGWELVEGRVAWPYTLVLRWVFGTHLQLHYSPVGSQTGTCENLWLSQLAGGGGVLASEAKGITKHPIMHRAVPTTVIWPKMSRVP